MQHVSLRMVVNTYAP